MVPPRPASVDGRTTRHLHRRPALLAAVTDYVLDHGVAGLSLRPTAEAIGVTHSTLLHHFASKEQLVTAVVEGICTDLLQRLSDQVGDWSAPTDHLLRTAWHHLCQPQESRQFLLLFELVALKARQPGQFGLLARVLLDDLLAPIEQNLQANGWTPVESRRLATGILGQIRGLQLDLALSGDRKRVDDAMHHYIELITSTG